MQLRISQLSKTLGNKPVLQDVSFTLEGGRIACLLGASGCGKTTLLRCVAGFEAVDSGVIELDGKRVATADQHVAPHDRGVGMVFQDHALFPHLTVAQNTAFGLHAWSRTDAATRVEEVLTLVGLTDKADRFPHELSGGQQQRAALARALATRPKLLLLDEPFASLDRDLRYRLVQDVGEILRMSGTTAVWVTHDAREALQAADVVGVMREGQIDQWDTPINLYQRPGSPDIASALGDCSLLPGNIEAVDSNTNVSSGTVSTALGTIAFQCSHAVSVGQRVQVLVRPAHVTLALGESSHAHSSEGLGQAAPGGPVGESIGSSNPASTPGQVRRWVGVDVLDTWFHGQQTLCMARLEDGTTLKVAVRPSTALIKGVRANLSWEIATVVVFA